MNPSRSTPFETASEWTGTVAVNATAFDNESGKLVIRGDWYHQSGPFKDAINSPQLYQPAYSVFGANVSYTIPGDKFTITVCVTNLTDERYIQGGFVELDVAGLANANYSRPREWFLKIGYQF